MHILLKDSENFYFIWKQDGQNESIISVDV
jgi:hypothetical protein